MSSSESDSSFLTYSGLVITFFSDLASSFFSNLQAMIVSSKQNAKKALIVDFILGVLDFI